MATVGETIVHAIADLGVRSVWGVVGDALNPITDAIRQEDRLEWIGVRHEEAGAFAAGAQAQLGAPLGVCMGTVGPGSLHLLNGLYDAKKSHAPVLAICGQVPLAELGSDFFQEVDNDAVFRDVAVFCRTITSPEQLPGLLEQAIQRALDGPGVAVLTVPGDVAALDVDGPPARIAHAEMPVVPEPGAIAQAAQRIDAAQRGDAARRARRAPRPDRGPGARRPAGRADGADAQGQGGARARQPLRGRAERADRQPGRPARVRRAATCCSCSAPTSPTPTGIPKGKEVIQVDRRSGHIGRRTAVDLAIVGDARLTVAALLELVGAKADRGHLEDATGRYRDWHERQLHLADPDYDTRGVIEKVRTRFDNPDERIRPEAVAVAVDRHAASDAIFTSDTGMSTVWLSRFVPMRGDRRLIGSYNLGSMANAMPQALGAQALDRDRQVIAFCGDGGLTMLLGDLITAVTHELPVRLVVFNNGRLGMVKLEQEQAGLPEFGTQLADVDLAAIATAAGLHAVRVEQATELDEAIATAFAHPGPVLLDVVTNPDEISLPPKIKPAQAWGFAIAKLTETLESRS